MNMNFTKCPVFNYLPRHWMTEASGEAVLSTKFFKDIYRDF